MAYDIDLRIKALDHYNLTGNLTQTSKIFGIGCATLRDWVSLKEETGSIRKRSHGGGHPCKIPLEELKSLIESNGNYTLKLMAEYFNVTASGVWKALKRAGYSYKKNSFVQ